jgi:hypothetical protein
MASKSLFESNPLLTLGAIVVLAVAADAVAARRGGGGGEVVTTAAELAAEGAHFAPARRSTAARSRPIPTPRFAAAKGTAKGAK